MSGRRPERTRALNFLTTFRKEHGDTWVTMPQFFKEHGYFTSSAGKIFHDGMDDPLSWSHPSNQTAWIQCGDGDLFHTDNYCGVSAASSTPYTDEDLALAEGLSRMTLAQQSGKPWWVSIGVHRPHTRYRVPDGFYGHQLYPNGTADLVRPPKHPQAPAQAPWLSGNWEGGDIYDGHRRAGFGGGCRECVVPTEHAIEYRRSPPPPPRPRPLSLDTSAPHAHSIARRRDSCPCARQMVLRGGHMG
jgi:iduronate 2-sulfatase